MTKKNTILDNSPLGWVITMISILGITVGWYFVFPHFWPYKMWIAWAMFAIPASITVLIPLMYLIRRIQRKRGKF